MTLHADLLAQARSLAQRESRRPRQASLRRAVSAAYYALFHLLTFEASRIYVKDVIFVFLMNRVYSHGEMKKVSESFAKGDLPRLLKPAKATNPVPQELKGVARAFVDLQQARHEADYSLAKRLTRSETLNLVERAEQAFEDWKQVRTEDFARLYLACFLVWDKWDKVR